MFDPPPNHPLSVFPPLPPYRCLVPPSCSVCLTVLLPPVRVCGVRPRPRLPLLRSAHCPPGFSLPSCPYFAHYCHLLMEPSSPSRSFGVHRAILPNHATTGSSGPRAACPPQFSCPTGFPHRAPPIFPHHPLPPLMLRHRHRLRCPPSLPTALPPPRSPLASCPSP